MKKILKIGITLIFGILLFSNSKAINNYCLPSKEQSVSIKRGPIINPVTISNPEQIFLNNAKTVSMEFNSTRVFSFKAPSTSLFVVETIGSCGTRLCVESNGLSRIFDGGLNKNGIDSKIQFKVSTNAEVRIYVHLDEDRGLYCPPLRPTDPPCPYNKTFDVLVRKPVFNCFTVDYSSSNGINTISDATYPISKLSSNFICSNNINYNISLNGAKEALNKEVVLFSGHGSSSGVTFYDGMNGHHMGAGSSLDMSNTNVVFWSGCETALSSYDENGNYIPSFAEKVLSRGAKCSIGFEKTVDVVESRNFTNDFFYKLSGGSTVKQAIQYAKNHALFFSSVRSVKIFGDENIKITGNSISNGYFETNITSPFNPGLIIPIGN